MAKELDDIPGGLPKNFMRPCILLLVAERPSHGYDLLERLEEIGLSRSDPGGLYRALRAMEQEGLLVSSWESSDLGPRRRTYELTDEGRDWLHAWAGMLRGTAETLRAFLDRYEVLDRRLSRAARRA